MKIKMIEIPGLALHGNKALRVNMVNHAWTMSFALGCSPVLLWWADDGAQVG